MRHRIHAGQIWPGLLEILWQCRYAGCAPAGCLLAGRLLVEVAHLESLPAPIEGLMVGLALALVALVFWCLGRNHEARAAAWRDDAYSPPGYYVIRAYRDERGVQQSYEAPGEEEFRRLIGERE